MRNVEVPLSQVLDIIVAADQYGYDKEPLMSWLALAVHPLTDQDIEAFAQSLPGLSHGYAEEDVDEARGKLTAFRTRWSEYVRRTRGEQS